MELPMGKMNIPCNIYSFNLKVVNEFGTVYWDFDRYYIKHPKSALFIIEAFNNDEFVTSLGDTTYCLV